MEEIGPRHRADGYGALADPLRAPLRQVFLLQGVVGNQTLLGEFKRLRLLLARVKALHRIGFAEEKAHVADVVQFLLQQFVAVNGEVG